MLLLQAGGINPSRSRRTPWMTQPIAPYKTNGLVDILLLQGSVRGLHLILDALDGLEVLVPDGLDVELSSRVLVDEDQRPGVGMERGERP